jgi:UDP-N-acetyl-D-glucosamine/UDP-N-acetyl-D-galactosamine dehydrogenase
MKQLDGVIAVIGLGYVGLPLAVEFAKSRKVIGFDINALRIAELQAGKDSTLEVSSDELKTAAHATYTADPALLKQCQVFIVTVPTPVDTANRPDMTPLVKASETVGRVLPKGSVVIYESTVYPGALVLLKRFVFLCSKSSRASSSIKTFIAVTARSALTRVTRSTR